ncbi:MAG: MFS transporter, partial [candidate division KSB1 bacterium]|nr:MFS transporter [candidate division KSB1 bacterium]
FAMLLLGGVVDRIGVRKSLILALSVMAIGRLIVSLSGTLSLGRGMGSPMFFTMVAGLLLMVAAYGLYQPAAYAGVRRYTDEKTAAMGYAVLYALMNLGAFLSGYVANFSRTTFLSVFPPNGLTAVFWAFTTITLISVLATVFILTPKIDARAVAEKRGEKPEQTEKKEKSDAAKIDNRLLKLYSGATLILFILTLSLFYKGASPILSYSSLGLTLLSLAAAITDFLRRRPEHPFRDARFMAFIFVLIPVQTLFAHNWLTIPYYLDRAFQGTWVGRYWEIFANINPVIIFIITPIIAGLTAHANVYRMMILGTFVMAAPTFLLAAGPVPILFLAYILIMSVGEAMWQPRFLQWVAEIAPQGKTGAYMGIGQFPWFLTKVLTSLYSGYFVARYIPPPSSGLPQQTGKLWLLYGFIAMISPLVLWLMKGWMMKGLREKSED